MKLLIVDDDPNVRLGLRAVLEAEGHLVTEADTAAGGHKALADPETKTDAVLLDIWLADESGLDLLRDIQAAGTPPPVVVMSGGGPGRSLERALATADMLGASAVLIKPFKNCELLEALAQATDAPH